MTTIFPQLRIEFSTDSSTGACSIYRALRVAWRVWRSRGELPRAIELCLHREHNGVYRWMRWQRIPWSSRIRMAQALRRYVRRSNGCV